MTLTSTGYQRKTFEDFRLELEQAVLLVDSTVNLAPETVIGQWISITSSVLSDLSAQLSEIASSFDPDQATGIILDSLSALTNTFRKDATKAIGDVTVYGVSGTVIPAGAIVASVENRSEIQFSNKEDLTIGTGINEVQTITFSATPASGDWAITYEGESTSVLAYNASASTIQTELRNLTDLSSITVTGNYSSGFVFTALGDVSAQDIPMLRITTNTLLTSLSANVVVTVTETTKGVLPNVVGEFEALEPGSLNITAGSLNSIVSAPAGVDSVLNADDIIDGTNIETDTEFKFRRNFSQANTGQTTIASIRAKILELDGVKDAKVYENDTDETDIYGRIAGSIHCVVLGGEDQEIVDVIATNKGVGVSTFGSESGTHAEIYGGSKTIYFDRPTEIDIFAEITIEVNSDYPDDGDDIVKQKIVDWADANLSINDTVKIHEVICAISEVSGIDTIEVLIDNVDPPIGTENLEIGIDEIANFNTANITVNSI